MLNPTLERQIREEIAKNLSRRHVPTFIFEVPEVPYNVNGKKLEIQVKKVLCSGRDGLAKLKVTKEESKHLEWFVRFHDIEKVLEGERRMPAKL
jgi:acetoacetyl-CoA synthetase